VLSVESRLGAGAAAKGPACSIENFLPPKTHVLAHCQGVVTRPLSDCAPTTDLDCCRCRAS
jgi:hypothetical protein